MSQSDTTVVNLSVSIPTRTYDYIVAKIKQADPTATDVEIKCFLSCEAQYWFSESCSEFEIGLDESIEACFPINEGSPLHKMLKEQQEKAYVPDAIKETLVGKKIKDW